MFKIHKLSKDEISKKVIPPVRLVHSTRQGPIYRLEKWCSPYLTTISKDYSASEFLLDTPDLLNHIDSFNNSNTSGDKSLLFTLDVVALYPSISVDMALKALKDAFMCDTTCPDNTKDAVLHFSDYILFGNALYETRKGIPTGISRQVADCSMHWLLFEELKIHHGKHWILVKLWKRYIDDILGRWKGTVRQFYAFVEDLNKAAKPFGIQFSDAQIGMSVHFLDVTLYIDHDGKIHHRLYRKETDSRQ